MAGRGDRQVLPGAGQAALTECRQAFGKPASAHLNRSIAASTSWHRRRSVAAVKDQRNTRVIGYDNIASCEPPHAK